MPEYARVNDKSTGHKFSFIDALYLLSFLIN